MLVEKLGQQKEGEIRAKFGVSEEADPLRKTLAWGPTGIEALLTRFIPPETSLFLEDMDVMSARAQFTDLETVLINNGAQVIRVRDRFALRLMDSNLSPTASSLVDLKKAIEAKALGYRMKHGIGDLGVLDLVPEILSADVERYGDERTAILLNEVITNAHSGGLPMANLLFGRDQTNMLGNLWVESRMRHTIREPEVQIWHDALKGLAFTENRIVIAESGFMEGGDVYISHGICYIGVGGRTNREAVYQLAPDLLKQGIRVVYVIHPGRDSGMVEHQTTMHLDTFSMPGPGKTMVIYEQEASERQAVEIMVDQGRLREITHGNFLDHLVKTDYDIIPVSREQQLAYNTNFVNLGNNRVLLTLGVNRDQNDTYLQRELESRGFTVILVDMSAITQGYGGAHCSLSPILRGC